MDLSGIDSTNGLSTDDAVYGHVPDNMAEWATEIVHQQLDDLDWGFNDPSLNVGFYERDPYSGWWRLTSVSKERASDSQTTIPSGLGMANFQPLLDSAPRAPTAATPLLQANPKGADIMIQPSTSSLLGSNQLFSSPRCWCRDNLAVLLPSVNSAMQEKQLDEVFRVTGKIVQSFQDIVECMGCKITCTDLICIMAVFQKTDTCFEYIVKADLDSAIKMSFGGHEVPINDPKLRAMLVLSLVYQATSVLDAISTKGQNMIQTMCSPSPLAKANIGYLETVIKDFRNVLRRVADSADETGTPSTHLPVAPNTGTVDK